MIVIVAASGDSGAYELTARWSKHDAAILTCKDLATPGWRYLAGSPGTSVAVVGGRIVKECAISGVLVRRPWVFERELTHIASEDREYCAAENNAFLVAWLASLRCPVVNPPSSRCLGGPGWRGPQWYSLASQLSIPLNGLPAERSDESYASVTVVGDRVFGTLDPQITTWATQLAAAANTPLLAARFAREPRRFAGANPWPSLQDQSIAKAVAALLTQ